MISFEMIGKLSLPKETDKFKVFEERELGSKGWLQTTLNFNVLSGDNRFSMRIRGGHFKSGDSKIYLFSKPTIDDNGIKSKGEMFTIDWKDRLTSPRLAEVAEFKKFVVDCEKPNYRKELSQLINKVKEGEEISEENAAKFGASDLKGLEEVLAASNKKRKEFVSEVDFAEFLHKLISSEKYKDKRFKVNGVYEMQYSEQNNRFYCNYVPQRVYLAEDSAEEMATSVSKLFYSQDSLVDAKEEKGKYYINGYVEVYDNNRKKNIFAPYNIAIDANDNPKKVAKLVEMFTVEDDDIVKEIGVVSTLLDGAQKFAIQLEDLDEEIQDNIMLGLTTLEDVRRELGGSVYGERIQENRFLKFAQGYSHGAEDTAYSPESLIVKPLEETNVFEDEGSNDSSDDDDDFDLFN